MTYVEADPKEWLLEVTPEIQSQLWERSQPYATPSGRWCAYINQICLDTFWNWVLSLNTVQGSIPNNSSDITDFWEFVNGTAILLNETRVVLIPSEAIDDSELEVPQEWVDIPSWEADFYLAVQVKPDEGSVRFWGYTTHKELKNETLARYDCVDRTYCMDARHLTKDLNAFLMAYQFCQTEDIKAVIDDLPELSTTEAENMLQQLGSPKAIFPRLKVPFIKWGALIEKQEWRQILYQQRQQKPQIQSSLTENLSNWLQGIYQASWQAIDTFINSNTPDLAFNFRSSGSLSSASIKRAKMIDLGTEAESQKVSLVVALTPTANQQMGIRIQLHPINNEHLPLNIKLVLLSESAEVIQEVQSRFQDNYVQLKLFEGEIGECFSIQVILDSYQVTEHFII
ncbi:MAG: DUF1822 family protein [Cyanobacteria bacterium P01_A01_bin.80]